MSTRIGVIRGGISPQYHVSLATGGAVIEALKKCGLTPVDILVTRDGAWHIGGLQVNPEEIALKVDCVWNALHGELGEDGSVQEFLDSYAIPYVGSKKEASELFHNKIRAKEIFKKFDIKTPTYEYVPAYNDTVFGGSVEEYAERTARRVWQSFSPPWVLKPLSSGSSLGVFIAKTFEELLIALTRALTEDEGDWIVEEFIDGKEINLGIIEGFRGTPHYTLIPKIVQKKGALLTHEEIMSGSYEHIPLSRDETHLKKELSQKLSRLFEWAGLRHYVTANFIASPRGLYILEIDTLPALHTEAPFIRGLADSGAQMPEFVRHIVDVAQNKK